MRRVTERGVATRGRTRREMPREIGGEGLLSAPCGLSRARIYIRVVFLPLCFSVNKRSSMDRPWRGRARHGNLPFSLLRSISVPLGNERDRGP